MVRSYNYDDFDLQIQRTGEKYRVQLLNSPSGQVTTEIVVPFTDAEVSNFLSRIGKVRRSVRGSVGPELSAAREFGGKLFSSVFSGELLANFRSSFDRSTHSGKGLRIRLRLTDVPEIADLPWEFLYDVKLDLFWATSTETPVVRFPDLPQPIEPLRVQLPLRLLVVIASPKTLPKLDTEGEWDRLNAALGDLQREGKLVVERLQKPTLDSLRVRARGEPFHILHFIGHGDFDKKLEDGFLQFETNSGMADPVRGGKLGMLLRDHRFLRLAVLNACEGARQSQSDPFSGVAQSLLRQRVPAVIAMQFEISDHAAKVFAAEFYSAIADGIPVDAAVSECRKALFQEEHCQEWATPVLYMRAEDGVLFEMLAPVAGPKTLADLNNRLDRERIGNEACSFALSDKLQEQPKTQLQVGKSGQYSRYRQYRWVASFITVLAIVSCIWGLPQYWKRHLGQLNFDNGNRLYDNGNFDDAIEKYNAAIQSRSEFTEAHANRAAAFFKKGNQLFAGKKYDDAIDMYKKAIDHHPKPVEVYNNLAMAWLGKSNYREAIVQYGKALEINEGNGEVHYNLGNVLYEKAIMENKKNAEDFQDVVNEYTKAYTFRQKFYEAHNNLGVVLYRMALLAAQKARRDSFLYQATTEFSAAIKINPNDHQIHANYSAALFDSGDFRNALAETELALVNPEYAQANNDIFKHIKDDNKALERVIQAMRQTQANEKSFSGTSKVAAPPAAKDCPARGLCMKESYVFP